MSKKKVPLLMLLTIWLVTFLIGMECNSYGGGEIIYDEVEANKNDAATTAAKSMPIKRVHLNDPIVIECELEPIKGYRFERIVFNRSIFDLEEALISESSSSSIVASKSGLNLLRLNSQATFEKYFDQTEIGRNWAIRGNQMRISNARYRDSGCYYCVYKRDSTTVDDEFVVFSQTVFVFDEQRIIKAFKDTVELDPCIDSEDNAESASIQWFYDDPHESELGSFINFDKNSNKLIVKLANQALFNIVYHCYNSQTGAFKYYNLECSNCNDILSAPTVSPHHQIVTSGADTQIKCEKAIHSLEPDRYQWFKQQYKPDETAHNFNLTKSIGVGPVLTLNNINLDQAGWYLCCAVTSPTSVGERKELIVYESDEEKADEEDPSGMSTAKLELNFACSTAELEVIAPPLLIKNNQKNVGLIMGSIVLVCALIIVSMSLLIYFCHKKLKTFKNTQHGISTMQEVPVNISLNSNIRTLYQQIP